MKQDTLRRFIILVSLMPVLRKWYKPPERSALLTICGKDQKLCPWIINMRYWPSVAPIKTGYRPSLLCSKKEKFNSWGTNARAWARSPSCALGLPIRTKVQQPTPGFVHVIFTTGFLVGPLNNDNFVWKLMSVKVILCPSGNWRFVLLLLLFFVCFCFALDKTLKLGYIY